MRLRAVVAGIAGSVLVFGACGPRKREIRTPDAYVQVQTASEAELFDLVNTRYAQLNTLAVARMRIEFTGGSLEKGYLEEYPIAKGYLVAQRPDSIFMNILNPVTSSTVVTMAASKGRFQIWVPRENKYVVGTTDLPPDRDKPLYSIRPDHLLEAVLIAPVTVGDSGRVYFLQEDQDAIRKYYVLHELDITRGRGGACLMRKIWVERVGLHLYRQELFECGQPISTVEYGEAIAVNDRLVSQHVLVERIREHYTLRLRLEGDSIEIDRDLKESAFQVPMPPGAELVEVEAVSERDQK